MWTASNLAISLKIVVDTLFGFGHSPALYSRLTAADVESLSPDTLATLDSIAVFANGLNVAFCTVALGLIWCGLSRRQRWSFLVLSLGFAAAWSAGTAADVVVGSVAPWVNWISLGLIAAGLGFAAVDLLRRRTFPES